MSEDFSLAYCQWLTIDASGEERQVAERANTPGISELSYQLQDTDGVTQRLVFGKRKSSYAMPDEAWQALAQGMVNTKNNALLLSEGRLTSAPLDTGVAWVDTNGKLRRSCSAFDAHIHSHWPSWGGNSLPFSIPPAPAKGFVWHRLYIRVLRFDDGIRLAAHRDRRSNLLTTREMEVARCVAKGCSFKEVGKALDISASTASTHLYKVYDKIGVRGRAALVQWLDRHESGAA
ncbi:response regulator transcription factor [Zhongshania sp.]|uniref:helix-turn-helix transcriptional regulator n=1 Tax=Zhongshania sp. TaxID=1971902 RepID=UPI00356144B7